MLWNDKAGAAVHYPEHDAGAAREGRGAASALADALLHARDAGAEQVYPGGQDEGYPAGFQDVEGEFARPPWSREGEEFGMGLRTVLTVAQYNFRLQALEGNLPGVKKASW